MWSRSRRLGLETVSSPDVLTSRLGLVSVSTQYVSGLGPFRLVETFCAGACRAQLQLDRCDVLDVSSTSARRGLVESASSLCKRGINES